ARQHHASNESLLHTRLPFSLQPPEGSERHSSIFELQTFFAPRPTPAIAPACADIRRFQDRNYSPVQPELPRYKSGIAFPPPHARSGLKRCRGRRPRDVPIHRDKNEVRGQRCFPHEAVRVHPYRPGSSSAQQARRCAHAEICSWRQFLNSPDGAVRVPISRQGAAQESKDQSTAANPWHNERGETATKARRLRIAKDPARHGSQQRSRAATETWKYVPAVFLPGSA